MKAVLWAVLALLLIAAILGGLGWKADRAWLEPPPPGRERMVVRVDGSGYDEGLATRISLELTMAGAGGDLEVGVCRRPRHMWVRHEFPARGSQPFEEIRLAVQRRMLKQESPWRLALIDDAGHVVSVVGSAGH